MDLLTELVLHYDISEDRAQQLIRRHPTLTSEQIADEEGLEEAVYVETEEYGLGGRE